MTPQGRSVKPASLYSEQEIFVYDNRSQAPADVSASIISQVPPPTRYSIPSAPNSIDDVKAIASWQTLYKDRRAWALRVMEDCAGMHSAAQARFEETDIMIRALDAAITNLEFSVKQIEPKYEELKKWAEQSLKDHARLAEGWQQYLSFARKVPVSAPVVKFMTRGEHPSRSTTLQDLINLDTTKRAGKLATTAHRRFSDKAAELDRAASKMHGGLETLIADFESLTSNCSVLGQSEESSQLLQDIEAVAKQIDSDYRSALAHSDSTRDVAQASKTASNHTERLVPNLKKRAKEMDELLQQVTQARNAIASDSMGFMRAIGNITSLHGNVKDQVNILSQSEDDLTTFDYLRLIQQLPYMYASFLAESIRRHEWNDKIKTDSSTLANEMALFQDEEAKRRRKWWKMVGSTYGPEIDSSVNGLEVSVLGDDDSWPIVSKEDLEGFLENLRALDTEESIIADVEQLIHELSTPTKQQSRRLKAFKNGSVHEAALGRSGLMIRGDDDLLRALQDDKSRLESKLKTAESRVRRLEDLLHRQSQTSRTGSLFQPQPQFTHERNGSVTSIQSAQRRPSEGHDALSKRIAELERDLQEERQRSSQIQQDLSSRTDQHKDMTDQIQEVNSTKKDLLENMEALKKEFDGERKLLEDEVRALKARLEDTEDEIENFGESRHKEKESYENRVHQLEADLERIGKQNHDDTLKSQSQIEWLRNETRVQREQHESLQRDLQVAREEARKASKEITDLREAAVSHKQNLKAMFAELRPNDVTPNDADLADAVQTSVTDVVRRLQDLVSDAGVAQGNLEQTQNTVKELRTELGANAEKLRAEEASATDARERAGVEEAKVKALEEELQAIRIKASDGDGSEALQKRVADGEEKIVKLTEELATRQSQVGSLEEELHAFKEKYETAQNKLSDLNSVTEGRDERLKDLTQRLYSQNDRVCHLLERMGYAVTRKEGNMSITKVPRAERVTQNPNDSSDPGNSIRKSTMLGAKALHESGDLELLHWYSRSEATSEAEKYEAFLAKLGHFDMDQFSDTVYHRVKEVEHKARKWQKEARSYRDRAHIQEKDAHGKIAYKHFKEGDLALFLPTRNQQSGAWAAFNVGFPHYFLREQDAHRLRNREWLVARITRIQERVVDLSKSLQQGNDTKSANEEEDDNPFQLSDGLRWYLIDAVEDKPGAPSTPGMGKSTVAANNVEATANIHAHATPTKGKNRDSATSIEGINKTLSKSLESRRSSSSSKRALPFAGAGAHALLKSNAIASETNSLRAAAPETPSGASPTHGGPLSNEANRPQAGSTTRRPSDQGAGPAPKAGEASGQEESAKTPEVRNVVDSLMGP